MQVFGSRRASRSERNETTDSARGQVARKEPRYVASIPITLRRFLPAGPVVTPGVSLDISLHGMSFLVRYAPRVGETVSIMARWAGGSLDILAKVRHSGPGGAGVEFVSLSPITLQQIEAWIEELRAGEQNQLPYLWLN